MQEVDTNEQDRGAAVDCKKQDQCRYGVDGVLVSYEVAMETSK
mgnify:CR=1 FL=1